MQKVILCYSYIGFLQLCICEIILAIGSNVTNLLVSFVVGESVETGLLVGHGGAHEGFEIVGVPGKRFFVTGVLV